MAAILDELGNPVDDETGSQIYDELGPPVSQVVTMTCNVHMSLSARVTMECKVGAPYQGNVRNLALDRWQPMYPG